MTTHVTLTIDGQEINVPESTLIVDAAKKIGVDIPVFCYHPKMEPVGMCRVCLVDVGRPVRDRATGELQLEEDGSPKIQFGLKLETACTLPVSEGMVVVGMSDKVKKGRKDIIEFLLTSHPLDCPVCDKGGECPLQNLTITHGAGESRYLYDDKIRLDKRVPLGELIVLDRERCIQCARCIRFQSEIVDDPVLEFYNRGRYTDIITNSEPGFDSYWSGNTTDICPVGALTTNDFRFGARPWELVSKASICSHCPVGCNITYDVRREAASSGKTVIKRCMPRQNEAVNEVWICDKGRFGYHYSESADRLTAPLIRKDGELQECSWDEALDWVAAKFKETGEDLLTVVSGRLPNEDLFNIQKLSTEIGAKTALDTYMAGGDLTASAGVSEGSDLGSFGPGDLIVVIASDLEEEAPIWWLRVRGAVKRGAKLIVANARETKLDRHATHSLRYTYGEEASAVQSLSNSSSDAAQDFGSAKNVIVFFGSDGTSLESSQILASACADLLTKSGHVNKANNGLIGVWPHANTQGAWDVGFKPDPDLLDSARNSSGLYFAASDPVNDYPGFDSLLEERISDSNNFTVVQELFLTKTAQLADVILPAIAITEREGTFTSGEQRVQRFYPAVPPIQSCKADFAIAAEIGNRLGLTMEGQSPADIMQEIQTVLPGYKGITYTELAKVTEQWPIIGREDLYYGGTSYDNKQGLGVRKRLESAVGADYSLADPVTHEKEAKGIQAVPVTKLYDLGTMITKSDILQSRLPKPFIMINPADKDGLKVNDGMSVQVGIDGRWTTVVVFTDNLVPIGVALLPRSFGVPIREPGNLKIKIAEMTVA